jgi:hypothetical protein
MINDPKIKFPIIEMLCYSRSTCQITDCCELRKYRWHTAYGNFSLLIYDGIQMNGFGFFLESGAPTKTTID